MNKRRCIRLGIGIVMLAAVGVSLQVDVTQAQLKYGHRGHWGGPSSQSRHSLNARQFHAGQPFVFVDASPFLHFPFWDGMIDHRYGVHQPAQFNHFHADSRFNRGPSDFLSNGNGGGDGGGYGGYGARSYRNPHSGSSIGTLPGTPPGNPPFQNQPFPHTVAKPALVPPTPVSGVVPMPPAVKESIVSLPYPIIPTKAVAFSPQQRAEHAFRNGQYQDAVRLARQVVTLDPDNGLARLFSAQTLFAVEDYENGVAEIREAIGMLPPEEWDYVVRQFRTFYGQNDYVDQMERLNQTLIAFPTNRPALLMRGYQFTALGHHEAGINDLQYAIAVRADERLATDLLRWTRGEKFQFDSRFVAAPQPKFLPPVETMILPSDFQWAPGEASESGILIPPMDTTAESEDKSENVEELPSPLPPPSEPLKLPGR